VALRAPRSRACHHTSSSSPASSDPCPRPHPASTSSRHQLCPPSHAGHCPPSHTCPRGEPTVAHSTQQTAHASTTATTQCPSRFRACVLPPICCPIRFSISDLPPTPKTLVHPIPIAVSIFAVLPHARFFVSFLVFVSNQSQSFSALFFSCVDRPSSCLRVPCAPLFPRFSPPRGISG
jgi:hypothetical protein